MPDYGIKRNSEGYKDPTAYAALSKIYREELEESKRVAELISVLKFIIDKSGYELTARIALREKRTGKEYR